MQKYISPCNTLELASDFQDRLHYPVDTGLLIRGYLFMFKLQAIEKRKVDRAQPRVSVYEYHRSNHVTVPGYLPNTHVSI